MPTDRPDERLFDRTRAVIAIIAAFSAFVAPFLMLSAAVFGFADFGQMLEMVKTWLAFIGPFAGTVIGYYFHRDTNPRSVPSIELRQGDR